MQFIYNEDHPPQGTPAVEVGRIDFPNPTMGQCYRHNADVRLINGTNTAASIIVPIVPRQDTDDDSDGDTQDTDAHAYMIGRDIKDAIYGSVHEGTVLKKASGGTIWEETTTRCALKILDINRVYQNRASAENPVKEVAAMQQFKRFHDGDARPQADMFARAEELMYNTRVMVPFQMMNDNRNFYSVMPFCSGCELFDSLEERKRFPEAEARYLFKEILIGLRSLQQAGICHRDISLENTMLDDQGRVIIIDMGMSLKIPYNSDFGADQMHRHRYLFKPDVPCGKPYYMSPEIAQSRGPFDGHTIDVWGTGPMLFLMVLGFPPWEDAISTDERFRTFSEGRLQIVFDSWNMTVNPDLVDLMQRMFFLDPTDRLSLEQILVHPWMQGPMVRPTINEGRPI